MSLSRLHRLTYVILLSLAFLLTLGVTIKFEISSSKQSQLSAPSGLFFTNLVLVRSINFLFVFTTLCMTLTVVYPGTKRPVVPFGFANLTVICAIFSFFFVYDLKMGAARYESRTLKRFNLKTFEHRSYVYNQLKLLEETQKTYRCCGLNDYTDYNWTINTTFDVKEAVGEIHPDKSTQLKVGITWGQFLKGAEVNYTFTDKCNRNETHTFEFAKRKAFSGDFPVSCCKAAKTPGCYIDSGSSSINTKGCRAQLLKIMKKINNPPNFHLLFIYPWVVAIYTFILTWAFLCQVKETPFKFLWIYCTRKPDVERVTPMSKKNAVSFSFESGKSRQSTPFFEMTDVDPIVPPTLTTSQTNLQEMNNLKKSNP